jgi:hypothetical protein
MVSDIIEAKDELHPFIIIAKILLLTTESYIDVG